MKKATFLLVVIVFLLSVFCTNAMAVGANDGNTGVYDIAYLVTNEANVNLHESFNSGNNGEYMRATLFGTSHFQV